MVVLVVVASEVDSAVADSAVALVESVEDLVGTLEVSDLAVAWEELQSHQPAHQDHMEEVLPTTVTAHHPLILAAAALAAALAVAAVSPFGQDLFDGLMDVSGLWGGDFWGADGFWGSSNSDYGDYRKLIVWFVWLWLVWQLWKLRFI